MKQKDWDGAMDIDTNHNLKFTVNIHYSSQMIKAIYPKADIVGEKTKSRTGLLEISVTRSDGQEKLIHSKKNGDGTFRKTNATEILQKLKDFVEVKQNHHKTNHYEEEHQDQKEAADDNQFVNSKSKEIVINFSSKKKQTNQKQQEQEQEQQQEKDENEQKDLDDQVKIKKQLTYEQLEEIEQLIKHHNMKLADKQKKEIEEMFRQAHMKKQSESDQNDENSRRSMQTRSRQKYNEDKD
ncbi:hypothetical protein pb186bvf_018205 [Paramecium bursaria]